ncbi:MULTISPECIES: enoyl-CoA hydratase/isomerase family protein [Rhodococcus]|uniref:Enoyl-CoA hydratase/isomerase family protein n=1 Tax=Rhodococcus oxybenzonivorans TaxID=1990687 RepID=A0AAE4V2H0_9NOCA|nr:MULTISPECIES: enoyl-CoA hydratase/isomerase family protein [Rhodococcus]MDV7241003.1 enoyl-CoA hydratase/isomerase family protein [Rhodococcus oxybenzonivorans]MDV7267343.1 enoyl-CoA hydratase/isomerase family protein [Rhodococcus oxybenzonivorans]MDV7273276.1 enoyl-CoA hydratase/isomerase family protein [Rhodococcus oxybenzonivorans]MDV7332986.1 enoyl-CoA hydratase/isomerase family protein [Rhodococcus oxybenzonivorans]MDV7342152.1 enoyl-CoA hydratase/isomerase family protein [Rhodococcus 
MYDMPEEIDVRSDGALRIITLNRPDALNAVNDGLHTGLARLWPQLSEDRDARAAVLTGSGKAFSAGGDFAYLAELAADRELRARTIAHGRELVLGMARCRIPVIAAVNGPAVGLGCSLVALSDIVYMAETAYLADPHVQVGLVAADGGPLTWPLQISLLQAKEYALTGARIPAAKACELGLANHMVADPLSEALACAKRIAEQPRQAVESTKRLLNMHIERAVLATLDYAMTAEELTFQSDDFQTNIARLTAGKS